MTMLENKMMTLESELKDANAALGEATMDRNNSSDDTAVYFARKDACTICRAKVALMKNIINSVADTYNCSSTQLVKI